MRITTGITLALLLLLLMSTAGIWGDDEDGGLATAQANNMQSAKPDTRTVDFSSVKWAWNAARTHLEPDSFPDARVRSGSNVWRRDSGAGLIRIFSDTDLSGMSFSTSGSSWPLSMRRAGLYVSNISGDDVERIRAGGGIGGRADEPTAINCWASEAGKEVTVDAVGASIETPVEVTCDRSIDLPDDEAVVKTAAVPSASPDWIDLIHNRYALRVPAGRSVYVDVILYPDDNGTSARVGNVVWPPVPPGEMASLSALVVHQPGRTVGSDNPPIILVCLDPSSSLPKRPGPCPDRVEVGSTVSLRAIVTPLPSGYVTAEVNGRLNGKIECSVGRTARTCGWRISQLSGSGTPGRFVSGDSVNLTWKAPSSPGSVTIGARYQIYVQGVGGFFPVPEHWSDNKGDAAGSNTLTFDVIEPTPPPDLRPHLSCDNGEPLPTDSSPRPNDPPRMGSCDSIDGANVEVTLTVTRPNGTTVSSLLYTVEWDVRGGGPPVISSSHPTSTTSRARHRLTWSSTGLTTGGQGVVTVAARPNGYDYAFNSTQVTIIVKERDLPPVVSEIACTPRVTPQGDNPAVCTATLDAPGGQGHLVDLSIDASDPNDDPLTYIWRAANGSFNGGVRTNQTTWDAAGLSTGQYTVFANVVERLTGVHERTVVVNVVRYAPPVQGRCLHPRQWVGERGAVPDDRGSVLRSVPRHPYQQLPMVHDGSRRTWRFGGDHGGRREQHLRRGSGCVQGERGSVEFELRSRRSQVRPQRRGLPPELRRRERQRLPVGQRIPDKSIVEPSAAGSIVLPAAIHAPTASRVWSRPKPTSRFMSTTRRAVLDAVTATRHLRA